MPEFYSGDAMREKFQERNADLPGLRGRGGSCIPLQFAFDGPPDTAAKPCFGLVSKRHAAEFIRKYEWLGDVAPIFRAFGAFWGMHLGGCVCFSYPPSKEAAKGVCGDEYTNRVMWLSRGAETPWAPRYTASQVVSYGLRQMQTLGYRIILAYADERAGEIGTIYQACNAFYTGQTLARTEVRIKGQVLPLDFGSRSLPAVWKNKASLAHILNKETETVLRPKKHRYIFVLGSHKERKAIIAALRYPILPYPKRNAVDEQGL